MSRYSHHYVNIDDLKYYCFWCSNNKEEGIRQTAPTYIEFDLALHMLESHRMAMVKLPIGKGNMEKRVDYAVEQCKLTTIQLREHPERWNEVFSKMGIGPGVIIITTTVTEEEEQQQQEEETELVEEDPYEDGELS